jgi:hypothetical protein
MPCNNTISEWLYCRVEGLHNAAISPHRISGHLSNRPPQIFTQVTLKITFLNQSLLLLFSNSDPIVRNYGPQIIALSTTLIPYRKNQFSDINQIPAYLLYL